VEQKKDKETQQKDDRVDMIQWKELVSSLSDTDLERLNFEVQREREKRIKPVDLTNSEKSLVFNGQVVKATKSVRDRLGCDLRVAYRSCRNYEASLAETALSKVRRCQ